MAQDEPDLFRHEGAIATITLNRPDRLNAITWRMIEDILGFAGACAADETVRVIVLTGAGRAFSSGDDIVAGMGERRLGGDPDGINADHGLHYELVNGPTKTYAAWKLAVNRSVLLELDAYTDYERQLANIVRQTGDHAEGLAGGL